jgi:hypothetical protein
MYSCFENIPLNVRQQAFDMLTKLAIKEKRMREAAGFTNVEVSFREAHQSIVSGSLEPPVGVDAPGCCYICPLGAINVALQIDSTKIGQMNVDELLSELGAESYNHGQRDRETWQYILVLPPYSKIEQAVLALVDITADQQSLERFIVDNDSDMFSTHAALAQALGVQDTSKRINKSLL